MSISELALKQNTIMTNSLTLPIQLFLVNTLDDKFSYFHFQTKQNTFILYIQLFMQET